MCVCVCVCKSIEQGRTRLNNASKKQKKKRI